LGVVVAGTDGGAGRMTKILVVTNMYPPHHFGGYELSCRDVVERWRARGHEVAVLTTSMRLPGVADDEVDRAVRRELRFYWDDHALVTPSIRERVRIERHNQLHLSAALDELRPDVVSVWNMGALSFGLLTTLIERRVPIVYVVCGDWLVHGVALDPWARLFAGRPTLARLGRTLTGLPTAVPDLGSSGTFCFISDALRAEAEAQSPWTYPISTVTYSGIDTSLFTSNGSLRVGDEWQWRLLYVGRVDRRKGIETAIRALAELPVAARLDIDGRGDAEERARLEVIASELGVADRVRFSESERAALPALYRAADVVVFPPIWDEPFGLVPLEAMACGTPVVATGTGGSAEFLRDGENCLLFPTNDHAALAVAVRRLAGDMALRARLVAGGARTAGELDVDRLAGVLEAWHVA
jgi:glycosyltransferase involved in cell wall biosynthesis